MHRLLKLTSLVLCLELILGPVAPGMSFISRAVAQDCPSGTQFDSTLNRCITTEQMANIMNATANCSSSDKECYKANAERALKEGEEEGKIKEQLANKGGLMGSGMKAAAVAVPMFFAMKSLFKKKQGGNKCPTSPSVWIMLGAGAAVFIGDTWANSKHKKRLKKIKEEWEGIRKGESSGDKGSGEKEANVSTSSLAQTSTDPDVRNAQAKESQAEAFEMLAKSEDSLASAAKFKSTFYAIGALAFAGAAVMSYMEAFRPQQPCNMSSYLNMDEGIKISRDIKYQVAESRLLLHSKSIVDFITVQENLSESTISYSSPSLDTYEHNKKWLNKNILKNDESLIKSFQILAEILISNLNPISKTYAFGTDTTPADTAATEETTNGMKSALPRAILSTLFAAWSGLMFMHAKKQASISKARAKYLRDRKDEFNDATGAISCTSSDRNNVNNLKCYCYTSSGQRNSQRANSQACVALFTGRNISGETNYLNGTGIASQKVCMTNSGIDENCACRSNNSCLSAVPTNFAGINPGSLGLISTSTSPLNQLTSGQIAAGSVDGAAAVSNALKVLDQAKKVSASIPEVSGAKGDAAARNMASSLIAATQGGSAPQLSSPSSGNPFSMNPSQAAATLEKELNSNNFQASAVKGGGLVPQPGAGKVDDFGLEFGLTPTQLAADQSALSQMNQNLDFGQNDINNSSSTNIFEVLSNRYQRSGMRRLFDDEGKMAADPASKSDITE